LYSIEYYQYERGNSKIKGLGTVEQLYWSTGVQQYNIPSFPYKQLAVTGGLAGLASASTLKTTPRNVDASLATLFLKFAGKELDL
jgi:hypothetical protein